MEKVAIAIRESNAVVGVLCRYFEALENGNAESIHPNPAHAWHFYRGEMTIGRMRTALASLDDYLNASSQHNWANTNKGNGSVFDKGPDLSRLPDAAVISLFQTLDVTLAHLSGKGS